MSTAPKPSLLIVDDEAAQMQALCSTLEDEGYLTVGFTSPADALASLRQQLFDVLLTDLQMQGMDGIELLRAAQSMDRDLVAIVMTGHGAIDTAVEAMKAGALD
jgi:two-component system sensor histidine kinase/response regulator